MSLAAPTRAIRQFMKIVAILAGLFLISVIGFTLLEHRPLAESIYLTAATLTTVGYGDVVPSTIAGRWLSVVIMLGGVSLGFYGVSTFAALLVEGSLGALVEVRRMKKQIETLHDHFIICGFGHVGASLARELDSAGEPFVILERNAELAESAREAGFLVLDEDATEPENLLKAGVQRARGLATAISDDAENLYITVSSRSLNRDMPIVARASHRRSGRYLEQAGATSVVYLDELGATRMARSLMRPDVVTFLEEMMTPIRSSTNLEAVRLSSESSAIGKELRELNLRARFKVHVIAIKRENQYIPTPDPDMKLQESDLLVVVGTNDELSRLADAIGDQRRAPHLGETSQ